MAPERAAALLGVSASAPADEVQRAFLRAARRTHPDTLPSTADDAARRAAAQAFDDLVRARSVLLHGGTVDAPALPAHPSPPPPPRRGIGGSLMVLALLAFLLVALVTLQDALRSEQVQQPVPVIAP